MRLKGPFRAAVREDPTLEGARLQSLLRLGAAFAAEKRNRLSRWFKPYRTRRPWTPAQRPALPGLDPDVSPAGAEFQVPRIARERGLSEEQVRQIISAAPGAANLEIAG